MKDKEIAKDFLRMLTNYVIIDVMEVSIKNEDGYFEINTTDGVIDNSTVFLGGFCNEQDLLKGLIDDLSDALNCCFRKPETAPDIQEDGVYYLRILIEKDENESITHYGIAHIEVLGYETFEEFNESHNHETIEGFLDNPFE